jgi:hypothetical protein
MNDFFLKKVKKGKKKGKIKKNWINASINEKSGVNQNIIGHLISVTQLSK